MFLTLVLIRNPVAFCWAIFVGAAALINPRFGALYLSRRIDPAIITETATGGQMLALVSRWPSGVLARFAYAYCLAHDVARVELYRAGRDFALRGNTGVHSWRRVFGPVTPGPRQLGELAAVVNKTTGYISLTWLAIPPTQQAIEALLFFPRYLRCLLGLATDAIQGRVRGNEARRLLATCVAVSVIAYVIVQRV